MSQDQQNVEPSSNQLPVVLKNFLSDVYQCALPSFIEEKIASECKQALSNVLLGNLQYLDDLKAQSQQQESTPLQQPQQQQTTYIDNGYEQQQQQVQRPEDSIEQQVTLTTDMDEVVEQQKDQTTLENNYGQYSYRGRGSYNLLTGEDDSYGGHIRGNSTHRSGKKIIQSSNNKRSNIFDNQNDNQYSKQFQNHPQINQSDISYEPNQPSRLKQLRLNTGNGVNRQQMRQENEKMYNILKQRNQRSNIFGN